MLPTPVITEVRKNIFINSFQPFQQGFEEQVKADLQKIEKNPIGKRLIEKIAASAHRVQIMYDDKDSQCIACDKRCFRNPKEGSPSRILYACAERFEVLTDQLQPLESPSFITLFHELVHAHHNSRGKNAKTHDCDKRVWTNDEEYKTIMGFPSKKSHRQIPKITENAFRIAQGLSCRYGHLTFEDLKDNPFLVVHVKSEKFKTWAKTHHDSVPLPIRNVTTEDLLDKLTTMFWKTIFENIFIPISYNNQKQ